MNKDILDIIFEDYHSTQEFIARMDQFLFSTRNLAVATASGVIAYAISQKNVLILAANLAVVLGFLFLDCTWKCFQEDAFRRTYLLEDLIQSHLRGLKPQALSYEFGLGHVIRAPTIGKILSVIARKDRWHNMAFYLLIAFASVAGIIIVTALQSTR